MVYLVHKNYKGNKKMKKIFIYLLFLMMLISCSLPQITSTENLATSSAKLVTCNTFQRGLTTVNDTELRDTAATSNFGANAAMSMGTVSGSIRQILIKFDISSIPTTDVVTSSTLTLVNNVTTPASTINVIPMTTAWVENIATWSNMSAPLTGTIVATGNSLGTSGSSYSIDITSLTSQWVNGSVLNNGVVLTSIGASNVFSSEYSSSSNRTKLVICHQLASNSCTNTIKDNNETDVDCGGTCSACANGLICNVNADCSSNLCTSNICSVPVCANGIKDVGETDIDCGGSCSPCSNTKSCLTNSDCSSTLCYSNVCYPLGVETIAPVTSCTLPSAVAGHWTMNTVTWDHGLLADIYQPAGGVSHTGRIIAINHPGGFIALDRTWIFAAAYAKALASRGDIAISFDYRLAPAYIFPAQPSDGRCEARWLSANAVSLGGNVQKIGCFGLSAGGTLCEYTAVTSSLQTVYDSGLASNISLDDGSCSLPWDVNNKNIYKKISAYYAPMDLVSQLNTSGGSSWVLNYLGLSAEDPLLIPRAFVASPINYTRPGLAPLFLEGGTYDSQVLLNQQTTMTSTEHQNGANSTLITVTNGAHFGSPLWTTITPPGNPTAYWTTANCTNNAFLLNL